MLFRRLLFLLSFFPLALTAQESTEIAGVTLEWERSGDQLIMTISAETEGWIAVGFDPEKKMRGANILIGYVDEDGSVILEDHYGHSQFNHRSDESLGGSSDVQILEGSETNGVSTIRFSIPLNSGDEYDKVLVPGQEHKVITAWGQGDRMTVRHNGRGSSSLILLPLD